MRILLDTNVLVRANEQADGPSRTLLKLLISQGHALLISNSMLVELARVLRYPRVQKLYDLSEDAIYQYVWFIRESAVLIRPDELLAVPMRDPKDILILQTAVAGDAEIICTLDTDFYAAETTAFCTTLGIEVCSDVELIGRLGHGPK